MRALLAAACVLLLSGCASSGSGNGVDPNAFNGLTVDVSATTGGIRGIVVDQAIVPIAKVAVALATPTGNKTATTDAQGRFTFGGLQPGTYFLSFSHLLYKPVQASVEVKAGAEPQITRVLMEALFTAKPYHEQYKFKGLITCGYQGPVITAPCVTDYSSISPTCPGGCAPELRKVQGDARDFNTSVGPNWQTMVLELVFVSNGQGTSDQMGILISFQKRTAGDWYGLAEGASPILLRLETGVVGPDEQGDTRKMIDPAGQTDLEILGSIKKASGQEAGVGINQEFQVFQTNFYNAKPPAGWSFANSDPFPF
ncbi:MAG TPA: carboxypeptidase-like regulatory domain-containing protein [Candidatus Thermoplasmatota archaeon]|nr:carboxypeptidase-like regulatory domain-containing protein [Candidatus Thermoplasmatota archaeon]